MSTIDPLIKKYGVDKEALPSRGRPGEEFVSSDDGDGGAQERRGDIRTNTGIRETVQGDGGTTKEVAECTGVREHDGAYPSDEHETAS